MNTLLDGRAWTFGANVTTDDILPGQYLDRSGDELGSLAMAGIDPEFARRIGRGDFIVAGDGFGMGSGRESAPMAIKLAGIGAIIAPSYSRIFYRNAINLGLPAVLVESIDGIAQGDTLTVDLERRVVILKESGEERPISNITGIAREILEAGGIVPFTRRRLGRA
jgi:3-isopropylmalate/(R)-2-methylmalate dehydratase small subunit